MTQDVPQWLAEIKTLKQQLAEAQRDCEQAYGSAANWQRLYETEAQQRRIEANLSRQTIDELKLKIQQLMGNSLGDQAAVTTESSEAVEHLQTPTELRQKLLEVLAERDRLMQALKTEQTNHAQTRKSLTTALGDAIDMLAKGQRTDTAE